MVPAPVPPLAAQLIEHSGLHAKLDELGYDDDLAADRVVGATDSCVPGSKAASGPDELSVQTPEIRVSSGWPGSSCGKRYAVRSVS